MLTSMKRLLPVLMVFGVFLLSAGAGWSADFQKGLDAYKSGDYATAPREWKPLVEQDVDAQGNLGELYICSLTLPEMK